MAGDRMFRTACCARYEPMTTTSDINQDLAGLSTGETVAGPMRNGRK